MGGKAIVVGGSSGLGAELVRQLASKGWSVASVARSQVALASVQSAYSNLIRVYSHDVSNRIEAPNLFEAVCRDLGGLDLIVYAAGAMPVVAPDEFDTEKDALMVETNFLGAIAWLNLAAARFQGVGSGSIVGIGSVAGDRGRAGQPVYNATKAALTTYLEALRNRHSRHGVKVLTIKPGPMATPMTAHLDQTGMMSAELAAKRIIGLLGRNGEFYLKPVHRLIFAVIRRIPSPIFRRLNL